MPGLKKFKKSYLPFFVFVGLFQWGFWMMCIYHKSCFYISFIKKGIK